MHPAASLVPRARRHGAVVIIANQEATPYDGLADVVVVPDRGGQGEDALQNADQDSGWRPAAVGFEVKLALEGVEDRLDGLPEGLEEL